MCLCIWESCACSWLSLFGKNKGERNNPDCRELISTSICLEVWKEEVNKSPHHAFKLFQIWSCERLLWVLQNGHRDEQCKRDLLNWKKELKWAGRKKRSKIRIGSIVKLDGTYINSDSTEMPFTFITLLYKYVCKKSLAYTAHSFLLGVIWH